MSEIRAALQRIINAQVAIDNARPDFTAAQIHELQWAHAVAKALLALPEPVIDSYAGDQPRGVFTNTGYHGTACGFIVRDGSLWSVTFKTQQDADDYIAWKNSRNEPEARITREAAEQLLEAWHEQRLYDRHFPVSLNTSDQVKEDCLAAMLRSEPPTIARALSEWNEAHGFVTWWKFPIEEPSWIGSPTDSDWPGYHTHWTPHPELPCAPAGCDGEQS